jgi:hypothetical protein
LVSLLNDPTADPQAKSEHDRNREELEFQFAVSTFS